MRKWLRRKLRKWLGIETLTDLSFEADQRLIDSVYHLSSLVDRHNRSFLGVDIGHEKIELMMLVYCPTDRTWSLVADNRNTPGTYQDLVRELRERCKEYNVAAMVSDEPSNCPPLKHRVLPGTDVGCIGSYERVTPPAQYVLFAHDSISGLYKNLRKEDQPYGVRHG